jgi:hypothetical protein
MKHLKAILLAAGTLLLAGVLAQPARADVSFDFAYSNLSQHGSWLVSAQYGRVWQPREYNHEWNPYYDGHWVDTDMGWTWVSDYEWGSLPYHYGTWVQDPRSGWVWIPGQVWAPSWVVFRTTPDYIGWAPVPPGFSVGVSMEFGAPSSFIYVSSRNFLAPRLRTQIIPANQTNVFINNTTIVNNIAVQNNVVINRGPDVRTIERATGTTIRQQPIEQVARVAPFDHVTRAQLAVAPERAKQGVRVAEPVPESRPLPVAEKQGQPNNSGPGKTSSPAPSRESAPVAPSSQAEQRQPGPSSHGAAPPKAEKTQQQPAPSRETAPVAPSSQAEQRQPGPSSHTATAPKAQHNQQAPAPSHEAAPVAPSSQAEQRQPGPSSHAATAPKAQHNQQAPAPSHEAAPVAPTTQAEQRQPGPSSSHAAQAPKAQNPQQPPAPAHAAAAPSTASKDKATAQQTAKAQADAKAKADKAKKETPAKDKDGADKGTTPGSNEEPAQK